jgi:hypothetical protein
MEKRKSIAREKSSQAFSLCPSSQFASPRRNQAFLFSGSSAIAFLQSATFTEQ